MFSHWQNLSIRKFYSYYEKWLSVAFEEYEPLKDICEAKFSKTHVQLCGFGNNSGLWTEWDIQNSIMLAEFEIKDAKEGF